MSNEIAQGVLGLAVSFWGGRGHRPGWVASCAVIHALTCFLMLLPHLMHGTYPGQGNVRSKKDGGKFVDRQPTVIGPSADFVNPIASLGRQDKYTVELT